MNIPSFLRTTQVALTLHRNFNCWTAAITKKHRKTYFHDYLTYLVLPDGGSIRINYHVPRRIIRLPVDINTVSEDERKLRMEKRKTFQKIKIADEYEDDFDESQFYQPSTHKK